MRPPGSAASRRRSPRQSPNRSQALLGESVRIDIEVIGLLVIVQMSEFAERSVHHVAREV